MQVPVARFFDNFDTTHDSHDHTSGISVDDLSQDNAISVSWMNVHNLGIEVDKAMNQVLP